MKRLCAAQVWRHLDYDGRWYDAAHPRVVKIVTVLGVLDVMAGRGYFPTFKAFATPVSVYIVVHDASSGQAHYCRWEVRLLEGGTSNDVTGGVVPKEARANNLVEWMELATAE